jgi:hypothetical protein
MLQTKDPRKAAMIEAKQMKYDRVLERVKQQVEKRRAMEDDKADRLLAEIEAGREVEDAAADTVHVHHAAHQKKVAEMHRTWEKNVFNKITGNISAKLSEMSSKRIGLAREAEYRKFIDASNTNGGLYLDSVLGDYDPFAANANRVNATIKKLHDPINRVVEKDREEKGMVDAALAPPKMARTRVILDPPHWAGGKIEATPHGKAAEMHNKQRSVNLRLTASNVMMDHYTAPTGKMAVQAEMPRGKPALATRMDSKVGYDGCWADNGQYDVPVPPQLHDVTLRHQGQ